MSKKRIQITKEDKKLLSSLETIQDKIKLHGHKYYPKNLIPSEGYKCVVWKGIDEYNSDVAIKITIYEDYIERSYLEEVTKACKLRNYPVFAHFYDADLIRISNQKFICFIEEWVDGWTLKKYLNENIIAPSFMVSYIRELCEGLNILKELNLQHDDLHLSNVMIAKPKIGSLSKEFTVKIIDTGSLKDYDTISKKEKDDHRWFTEHTVEIWNSIQKNKNLSLMDKRFQKLSKLLIDSMLEEDRSVALFEPSRIIDQFEIAQTKSQYTLKQVEKKLEDPFNYISAEHITSDKLLVDLFAESCPWMKEIVGPNPVILTGPRGCGKSMLFRRISLKALLYKSLDDLKKSTIVGFYISCSADLRNRLISLANRVLAIRFQKEIIHYFNLLLCREIIQTLLFVKQKEDIKSIISLRRIQEKEIHTFIMNKLGIKEERRLRLQGVSPLVHLIEIIEFEMNYCYEQMVKGYNLPMTTTISFVTDLTKFLKKKFKYFNDRTITFLLDDYSIHRIPESIQYILNPIIWDRQATHIFKLSTEKYGAASIFDLPNNVHSSATADITREFREIDAGQYYIDLSDKGLQKINMAFAKELLDHRLKLAGYSKSSEFLIGDSNYKEGSLGKELRARSKHPGRKDDQYHGLKTISEICSGDVSALLEIYYRIFKEGKVSKKTQKSIPKHIQHSAIESVSRNFLNRIKNYSPFGEKMDKIVINFGTLSRKILRDGKLQKSGKKFIPCETTRIEVDQIQDRITEDWSEDQEKLMKELVRRSIFIEMEPGRGRQSLGPTIRWQLRRIYCPAFGTSLTKNAAIIWNMSDFKFFLTNPEEKCKQGFNRFEAVQNEQLEWTNNPKE